MNLTDIPISLIRNFRPFCKRSYTLESDVVEYNKRISQNIVPYYNVNYIEQPKYIYRPKHYNKQQNYANYGMVIHQPLNPNLLPCYDVKSEKMHDFQQNLFDSNLIMEKWNLKLDSNFENVKLNKYSTTEKILLIKPLGMVLSKNEYRGSTSKPVEFSGSLTFSNVMEDYSLEIMIRVKSDISPSSFMNGKNSKSTSGTNIQNKSNINEVENYPGFKIKLFNSKSKIGSDTDEKNITIISTTYESEVIIKTYFGQGTNLQTSDKTEAAIKNDINIPDLMTEFRFIIFDYGEDKPIYTNFICIAKENANSTQITANKDKFRYYSVVQEISPYKHTMKDDKQEYYVCVINSGKNDALVESLDVYCI
ncbi:unnamed protein product [Gordionus sp. m RMFG-2023]